MTRAAARAAQAADALLEWLRTQPPPAPRPSSPDDVPAERLGAPWAPEPGADTIVAQSRAAPAPHKNPPANAVALRLAHTDWLHHRLTVTGPASELAALRAAAAGAGTIPWQLDLDRLAEDVFHLLAVPPPPQHRSLSIAAARIVAGQLREAVARRHAVAVARVGHSRACPFDLHALVPVPDEVLRRGPDDPQSLAWLWQHWGTTQALRHVAEAPVGDAGEQPRSGAGQGAFRVAFWSADWTPWQALLRIRAAWPALCIKMYPIYTESTPAHGGLPGSGKLH